MHDSMMRKVLESYFPFFDDLDEEDRNDMSFYSFTQEFKAGEVIVAPDDKCFNIIIVLDGRLKSLYADREHPLLLYYLNENDVCTLASSEELYGISNKITLIADLDSRILKTPSWLYKKLKDKYPQMSIFLRKNFMDRFSDILYILRSKGLSYAKQQVASYLYDLSVNSSSLLLKVKQEDISQDVGLSRSQVSNILRSLESDGMINNSRGMVQINDLSALGNV